MFRATTTRKGRRCRIFVILFSLVSMFAVQAITPLQPTALAWKPKTHVYLAEEALADAIDDGNVTIYQVDYRTGQIIGELGEYEVEPSLVEALRDYPSQFRAGVVGPDAYPDLHVGQQLIHPSPDGNSGGTNSDEWLAYLWQSAHEQPYDTLPVKAFVAGYLVHAAGDMYGHTFVNHFSGGEFELGYNALKHLVLEGYLANRTPHPSYDISIDGVYDFIYRRMTFAEPNSTLDSQLIVGANSGYALPRIFSSLRNDLQRDIDDYDNLLANYDRRIDEKKRAAADCALLDLSCSAAALQTQALQLAGEKEGVKYWRAPIIAYKKCWRDDLDEGLQAWPSVSHRVAQAITFNPEGTDFSAAGDLLGEYVERHLLAMTGLPDDACGNAPNIYSIISDALDALDFIPFLAEAIDRMKRDLLNYIVEEATGWTIDEIKDYLTSPERYFDEVMAGGEGQPITLRELNQSILKLQDSGATSSETFDWREFPAAYNTVTLTKLILLTPEAANQLLADLGAEDRLDIQTFTGSWPIVTKNRQGVPTIRWEEHTIDLNHPNVMLDFIRTLDGDNEWHNHDNQLIFAREPAVYRQLFMCQTGERTASGADACQASEVTMTVDTGSADRLIVRTGPGFEYPEIVRIYNGESYLVVAREPSGVWLKIRLNTGQEGWIRGAYTRITGSLQDVPMVTSAGPAGANQAGANGGQRVVPVDSVFGGEEYALWSAGIAYDNNCMGSMLMGSVHARDGSPISGVRIGYWDAHGRSAIVTTRSDAALRGSYQGVLLSDQPHEFSVALVDETGRQLSKAAVVQHLMPPAGNRTCHYVVWTRLE